VGAGASGAIAARYLAERGFRVVCLEQGPWHAARDYPGDRLEWELLAAKRWHPDPNVRGLPEDYPCDVTDSTVAPWMVNAVGGGTIRYNAHWGRFLPSDFRVRSEGGVAADWPLTYDDLAPYYAKVEREMVVAGKSGDPAYPSCFAPPHPALPVTQAGLRAAQGMARLGWHWWPGTNAIDFPASRTLRGVKRASVDRTHWPAAIRRGARLITQARVREITLDTRGMATGAIYVDRNGVERYEAADVVILAANGVGTPRILLMSKSSCFPDGLANSSGLVGKGLMMHPLANVTGWYDDWLGTWWSGPGVEHIRSMEFYASDDSRGFVRGAKWVLMLSGGPMSALARLEGGDPYGTTSEPVLTSFDSCWGQDHHKRVGESLGHTMEWVILAEDLPDDRNYVALDAVRVDSSGLPAPKIVYRTSANTNRLAAFHIARAREAHQAACAYKTTAVQGLPSSHLMGTTRMGVDPRRSVVDPDCRAHDVPNLYIVDGSVFVTSAGVGPTATICALARRCVETLAARAHLGRASGQ
jgi:choline dehydrogenase-like flavoprotein